MITLNPNNIYCCVMRLSINDSNVSVIYNLQLTQLTKYTDYIYILTSAETIGLMTNDNLTYTDNNFTKIINVRIESIISNCLCNYISNVSDKDRNSPSDSFRSSSNRAALSKGEQLRKDLIRFFTCCKICIQQIQQIK